MRKLYIAFTYTFLLLLTACNGSSGKNTSPDTDTPTQTTLSVSLSDSNQTAKTSFAKDEVITVVASVKDQFGVAMANTRVDFSTDLGELSPASKLTDTNGQAIISIGNANQSIGAGTLTISTTSLETTTDYEFLDNVTVDPLPTMTIAMEVNGQASNRFTVLEEAYVKVNVVNERGEGLENERVFFTADVGELEDSAALTSSGDASVKLTTDPEQNTGAGVVIATLENYPEVSTRIYYQILKDDSAVLDDVRIGYLNDNGEFTEGEIRLSGNGNLVSAGGSLGLSVDLVDPQNNRISSPTTVTFTSNCVQNANATIDNSVTSIGGTATSTYQDIDCSGVSGTQDTILASITNNGVTASATAEIEIAPDTIGSIEFVSSVPTSIVVAGTGGQETSTVSFLVKTALGNVLPQQNVSFSLDTTIGGVSLSRTEGVTNSQGLVSTQVVAGTVPTVIRVTATAQMESNGETLSVQTQSSELSINTGLPEQTSMTIAASVLNPEASFLGTESTITVWLADYFNNPVLDGTAVNFSTEGGNIESKCFTVDGKCSVQWEATEPILADHRTTILATTAGHETFFDTNGNFVFEDADGNAITNAQVEAGWTRQAPLASGFVDMAEAWRDDDADNIKDPEETVYFDDNQNSTLR